MCRCRCWQNLKRVKEEFNILHFDEKDMITAGMHAVISSQANEGARDFS